MLRVRPAGWRRRARACAYVGPVAGSRGPAVRGRQRPSRAAGRLRCGEMGAPCSCSNASRASSVQRGNIYLSQFLPLYCRGRCGSAGGEACCGRACV